MFKPIIGSQNNHYYFEYLDEGQYLKIWAGKMPNQVKLVLLISYLVALALVGYSYYFSKSPNPGQILSQAATYFIITLGFNLFLLLRNNEKILINKASGDIEIYGNLVFNKKPIIILNDQVSHFEIHNSSHKIQGGGEISLHCLRLYERTGKHHDLVVSPFISYVDEFFSYYKFKELKTA